MRAAKTGLLVAACALAGACDGAPGDGTGEQPVHRVLARVGVDAETRPPLALRARKLDTRTRNAVDARAFELRIAPGARRLAWSSACVPADAEIPAQARFRILQRTGSGGWSPLSEGETAASRGWRDHEASLPQDATALRFEVPSAGACEPLWGSPLLLGPGPRPPAGPADPPAPAPRPNIVLMSLDTLGAASLGAFSREPGVSPHLDAFLDEGASFRRAYAQYGNTLVSHASLFTALHPRRHGVYTDVVPGPLEASLVRALADAGYRTIAFTEGAFVSAAFGFAVGFDAYDDGAIGLEQQMAGGAAETFDRAADWIEQRGANDRFFLFLHTYEVHSPYLPEGEALRVADRLTPGDDRVFPRELQGLSLIQHNSGARKLPPRDLARLGALHVGEVHALDAEVGRFLARLERAGLAAETLVVVTSDHGDQFGEGGKVGHGDSLHDRVLHVPLAFRWPGVIASRRIEAPVQLVDVLPTLLDLAGLPVPEALDGASLAAVLTQGAPAPERPAFSEQRSGRGECARLGLENGCRLDRLAVHSGRFKLIESRRPRWQRLHDLARDPLEERDVSDAHPEVVRRLSALLEGYRARETPQRDPDAPALDAETVERLRALGYAAPEAGGRGDGL